LCKDTADCADHKCEKMVFVGKRVLLVQFPARSNENDRSSHKYWSGYSKQPQIRNDVSLEIYAGKLYDEEILELQKLIAKIVELHLNLQVRRSSLQKAPEHFEDIRAVVAHAEKNDRSNLVAGLPQR